MTFDLTKQARLFQSIRSQHHQSDPCAFLAPIPHSNPKTETMPTHRRHSQWRAQGWTSHTNWTTPLQLLRASVCLSAYL